MLRPGFTLIETVIVLSLLSSTLFISVTRFPTRQRQLNAERAFWQQFRTLWQTAALTASATGVRQLVDFQPHAVVTGPLDAQGHWQGGQQRTLNYPTTLRAVTIKKVKIERNGHPTLAAVKFKSQLEPRRMMKFTALMGWGAYRVAEKDDATGFYLS